MTEEFEHTHYHLQKLNCVFPIMKEKKQYLLSFRSFNHIIILKCRKIVSNSNLISSCNSIISLLNMRTQENHNAISYTSLKICHFKPLIYIYIYFKNEIFIIQEYNIHSNITTNTETYIIRFLKFYLSFFSKLSLFKLTLYIVVQYCAQLLSDLNE